MERGCENRRFCIMTLSQTHLRNADQIDALEDIGRVGEAKTILLHWINNLEETAREMVVHNNLRETEELDFAFSVAQDYGRRMVRCFGIKHRVEVGRGISSYNTILSKGKVHEDYMIGEHN